MKYFLFIQIIIFGMLLSCKKNSSEIKYDLDKFESINSTDIFKKAEVVFLEDAPDLPLSLIWQFLYDNNKIYIRDQYRSDIVVYDIYGKFIRTIGSKGRGPGELEDIREIQINRFTGNIELLGNASPMIMAYDTSGQFIRQRKLPNLGNTIEHFYQITPDLTVLLSMGHREYRVHVYSESEERIVRSFLRGYDSVYLGFLRYSKPFSSNGDTVFFFNTYSNTIYYFNTGNLEFEVFEKFELGKDNFEISQLPNPQKWELLSFEERSEIMNPINMKNSSSDSYFTSEKYSLLRKGAGYHILYRDNDTVTFKGFSDIPYFFIGGINDSLAYGITKVKRLKERVNETLIGQEAYQNINDLNLNNDDEERYALIKYWFK
jgi:hypothetical protein